MFSQSFTERSLNLIVREADRDHGLRLLRREFESELALGRLAQIDALGEVGTVSVVGAAGRDGASIVPLAFASLGRLGSRVISVAQASSEYNVSFVLAASDVAETVQALHSDLGL